MAKSLELLFSGSAGASKRKGPYPCVRLEGEVMRAEVGGPVIAAHRAHAWHLDGEKFSRLECESTVQLHFERVDGSRSQPYGPYASVSFVDGVAYADHQIFAFVDRSIIDWYCHADGRHWPLMVMTPADQA